VRRRDARRELAGDGAADRGLGGIKRGAAMDRRNLADLQLSGLSCFLFGTEMSLKDKPQTLHGFQGRIADDDRPADRPHCGSSAA